MLNHRNEKPLPPKRVVILGAKGFVGATLVNRLSEARIATLALGRAELDLSEKEAGLQLANLLRPEDALVVITAKAPCKNYNLMLENIQIMHSVCDALVKQPVSQVIYISSDAVYTDSMEPLRETSLAAPTSLHGAMHLAREQMLQSVVKPEALAILRPSLLYGANDPHNGYGPNSFYRLARSGQPIALFGLGEEQRDHVYIEDVAELIYLCLLHHSFGVLNVTTGEVASFAEIVALVGQVVNKALDVTYRPRSSPMPHNGYRAFDNTVCQQAFSGFHYTPLTHGLKKMHQISTRISCTQ